MEYVIQKHTHEDNPVHWDLMLKEGERLLTWRVEISPSEFVAGKPIAAKRIADHPLKFLTYQGPVNNGLGNVMISDLGSCEVVAESENDMTISFKGKILKEPFDFSIS